MICTWKYAQFNGVIILSVSTTVSGDLIGSVTFGETVIDFATPFYILMDKNSIAYIFRFASVEFNLRDTLATNRTYGAASFQI